MTWSYDPEMGTEKDQVRFLIHDTVAASPKLQNEEIEWLLTQESNVYMAAALACDTLAASFREAATSRSVGGLSISYTSRAAEYAEQGATLRARAQSLGNAPVPISTAQSKSTKELRADDDDLNLTPLSIGMHDNEGTSASNG